MELYLTIILMLILIIAGAVAFCAYCFNRSRRAEDYAEAALDAAARLEVRLELAEREILNLHDKTPQSANESAGEGEEAKAQQRNKQLDALMGYQLRDYGLKFEGGGE